MSPDEAGLWFSIGVVFGFTLALALVSTGRR